MVEMKEEFFEWLSECPVQWFFEGEEDGSRRYVFINDEDDEELE